MQNPGYLTDAIFHHLNGEITERDHYWLIRTPSNPTFFWGNFLLFKKAPSKGCFQEWMGFHREEFGERPQHVAIGWDCDDPGDSSEFQSQGFDFESGVVLSLTGEPATVPLNPNLTIRKFDSDKDWHASLELQIDEGFPGMSDADYRIFKTDQMSNYRRNQERGHGDWWGAFLGDELVGDMGLYFDRTRRIGRFQNVTTAKAHRRKGVCTTLLNTVVRSTFETKEAGKLVLVADQGSIAEGIYRSLGFTREASQFGLCHFENPQNPDY